VNRDLYRFGRGRPSVTLGSHRDPAHAACTRRPRRLAPRIAHIGLAVAVGFAGDPTPGLAHPRLLSMRADPYDVYEATLAQAEQASRSGDFALAVDLYTRAYEALPAEDRAGELGSDLVHEIAATAQASDERDDRDVSLLRSAIEVIDRHLAVVSAPSGSAAGGASRESLAHKRLQLGARLTEITIAPESVTTDETRPTQPPAKPRKPVSHERRKDVAFGLLAGGVVVLGGGIGLLAGGGRHFNTTEEDYERSLAANSCTAPDCDLEGWYAQERREIAGLFAGGGILAAVGVALLVTGGVIAASSFKRDREGRSSRGHTGVRFGLVR